MVKSLNNEPSAALQRTFCGFVSGCEALALSGRAACTKPLLCDVFIHELKLKNEDKRLK